MHDLALVGAETPPRFKSPIVQVHVARSLALQPKIMQSRRDGEKVTHLEKVASETVMGNRMDAWDVRTNKRGRWWVITNLTNLYSQKLFPSLDYTISFHVGVTTRVMSQRQPRVSSDRQQLVTSAWRRWVQAAEALDAAEEIEEFQAVGMRCRETLLVAMDTLRGRASAVPDPAPKNADFVAWSELIAAGVALGASAEEVRHYLRGTCKTAWRLVNWLTHAKNATRSDAEMALNATEQVLVGFACVIMKTSEPTSKCPNCGSSKLAQSRHVADGRSCQSCGWEEGAELPEARAPE
ncbi:MAG TPA: gamma-glutamylcyclotransferase [Alphaproteobacteria bacterium]